MERVHERARTTRDAEGQGQTLAATDSKIIKKVAHLGSVQKRTRGLLQGWPVPEDTHANVHKDASTFY